MKKYAIVFVILTLSLLLAACGSDGAQTSLTSATAAPAATEAPAPTEEPAPAPTEEPAATEAPAAEPAPAEAVTVEITVRDYGVIRLELDPAAAPATVANFVALAESGFYDGLTFHRIMDGFMIQGGDPTGTGYGGSEENIPGEFAANGFDNPISHVKGVISMARAQDYNSASSQFFITEDDATFLDGLYAAFGRVTEGMDVVERIAGEARPTDNNGSISPEDQPVMESVKILPAP